MKRLLSLLFLSVYALAASAAAGGEYVFNHIDAQTNLSHSAVLSIYQDRQGLMWFGTYDGLNCYDGKNMSVFRSDSPASTGLTNNVIMTVSQADDNCIWCATDYTLNKFSQETFTTETYDLGEEYTVHSNSNGDTYLIRRDSLYYYNKSSKEFLPVASGIVCGSSLMNRKVYVTKSGEFWHFNEDSGRIGIYSVSSFDAAPEDVRITQRTHEFHNKGILEVFWQKGIIAFVDVDRDLFLYDTDNRSKLFVRNISSLIDQYGSIQGVVPFYEDIFIGFAVNGLVKLSSSDGYEASEVDKNMRIFGLHLDSDQGILWIATDGQGAVSYTRENNIAESMMLSRISPGLSRQVRSIMTDENGTMWFGTKGDGLVKVPSYESAFRSGRPVKAEVILPHGRVDSEEYVRDRREYQIYSMTESDSRDGFWVGTGSNGLYFYSTEDDRLVPVASPDDTPLKEIHAIEERGDTLYVICATTGLYRLTVEDRGREGIAVADARMYPMYVENHRIEQFFPMVAQGDSLLWVGSRTDGLIWFDCRTEEYKVVSLRELVDRAADDVLSLCLTDSGKLYVGTTAGLVSMDTSGDGSDAVYVGREDGLLNDMIHGIVEDGDGLLYLSTNKGLAKYNPTTGMVHNYYYSSGVEVGEFSDDAYYRCNHTGDVFFGGVNGLVMLNKDVDNYVEVERDLLLRGISVGRQDMRMADYIKTGRDGVRRLILDGYKVSFSLFYGVPDFLSGADIEYSYKLEGYDDAWSVFSSGNEARFNAVKNGRYEFKVRYKKDVFDAEYKTFSIPVRIVPPWFVSLPAMIAYILLLVFVSVLTFRKIRRSVIMRRPVNMPVGKMPNTGQDIIDRMAVIYNCCDRLRAGDMPENERRSVVELMRDTLSGILYGGLHAEDIMYRLPVKFAIANSVNLSQVSKEVLDVLSREGHDVSRLEVVVDTSSLYRTYANAFKRILYVVYGYIADSGIEASVVFEKNENRWLNVVFRNSWEHVWAIYDRLELLFKPVLEQHGIEVTCVDKGASSLLMIQIPPADMAEADESKNNIVLLGQVSDLTWLISDMLAGSYNVVVKTEPDEAFAFIQKESTVLLMVDMRLFEGRESQFIESLNRNHTIAGKVSLLPMFTWNTDQNLCRELILISDAYMMLPYDILMLKNVVHKAIFGKGSIADVHVEDLLGLGDDVSAADADFIAKVLEIIEDNIEREDLGTSLVADRMALSTSSFYRRFKKITGISLEMLIKNYRLEKAANLLKDTSLSIADVIADVGISSRSYFYKEFSKKYGMTPKEYRDALCSDLTSSESSI